VFCGFTYANNQKHLTHREKVLEEKRIICQEMLMFLMHCYYVYVTMGIAQVMLINSALYIIIKFNY